MSIADPSATVRGGGARETGPLRRTLVVALLVAAVFGAVAGRFVFLGSGSVATDAPTARAGDLGAARAAAAAAPDDPAALAGLASAALTEARRTADPARYAEAETAVERALALDADDPRALVVAGLLALTRHDFDGALELAQRARSLAPLLVDPMGVEIDALVELGRYDEALEVAQAMVGRRPNASSLPRLSYVLELRGDTQGALEVMQQAVAAAGDRGPDAAYVLSLLGELHLGSGRIPAAEAAYARALAADPAQNEALIGRAELLIATGDLAGAAAALKQLTDAVPLPEAVALRSDVLAALGDEAGAAALRAKVRVVEDAASQEGGIAVDLEVARFEADHARLSDGDAAKAVELARRARGTRATIYGDDTLAWALRQDGRPAEALELTRSATRFGTADAGLWWHRAAIEADLGLLDEARAALAQSFAISAHGPLVDRAERLALAARLGMSAPAGA